MVSISELYDDFKELIKQNFYDKDEVDAKILTVNGSIPIIVSEYLPTPSQSYHKILCIARDNNSASHEFELYICKAYQD